MKILCLQLSLTVSMPLHAYLQMDLLARCLPVVLSDVVHSSCAHRITDTVSVTISSHPQQRLQQHGLLTMSVTLSALLLQDEDGAATSETADSAEDCAGQDDAATHQREPSC
jgi:hypothetical protein